MRIMDEAGGVGSKGDGGHEGGVKEDTLRMESSPFLG